MIPIQRNSYQQVPEFDRCRILAYQEFGLMFHDISLCTDRNPTASMLIWNQWVAECHIKWHAGSSCPTVTTTREDRHILRSALQNRTTILLRFNQQTGMFAERSLCGRTVRRLLQQRGVSAWWPLLRLPLTIQHTDKRHPWCAERQNWMKEWHNVFFADESRYCLQYSGSRIRVWGFREDHLSSACI
ncbi:transposable element Tc1 transposase [Trichonephila clavipes]|nr:transposable element Tc1 transposase [Trichonephila clavipes]